MNTYSKHAREALTDGQYHQVVFPDRPILEPGRVIAFSVGEKPTDDSTQMPQTPGRGHIIEGFEPLHMRMMIGGGERTQVVEGVSDTLGLARVVVVQPLDGPTMVRVEPRSELRVLTKESS